LITVIARRLIGHEAAPGPRLAAIVGTGVAVITLQLTGGNTPTQMAVVAHGTNVTVCARGLVKVCDATQFGVAVVVRAGIPVIAGEQFVIGALPLCTVVTLGTDIAIVAGSLVGSVKTAAPLCATVIRACVAVITQGRNARLAAKGRMATLNAGAWVAVIAAQELADHAATIRIAGLGTIAHIAIVARQQLSRGLTLTLEAVVAESAEVPVMAGHPLVRRGQETAA